MPGLMSVLACLVVMVQGCCGPVRMHRWASEVQGNALWRIEIIKDGEVLFQGLLARHAGHDRDGPLARFWLVDSSGLTFMKLVSRDGEMAVLMALPPFDESYISDYISRNMEVSMCCHEPDSCVDPGFCGIRESECEVPAGKRRCFRGRFGFFNAWELACEYGPGKNRMVEGISVKERYPGMEMRFKRLR